MNVKQIIVIRKDLKMRRGKEIAQGAHASMAWLTNRLRQNLHARTIELLSESELAWIEGLFTKVVVQVPDEESIQTLYNQVKAANLEAWLITDAGLTEFNGIPTVTALGIGPDLAEKIDPFTCHLVLY